MGMPTNAFSKKVENHAAAIALYFMYYNFGRVHQTLRVTPAMEAGVANHEWVSMRSWGCFERPEKEPMTMTARKIARHIITMIVILVALTALAIWLGLGPVVHSSTSPG